MGATKTDLFTEEQNALATAAKAFAHPARVAIIQYLIKSNACINGDLVQELGLAQPTISQHLRELRDLGIIQGSIDGSRISYCINPTRWTEVQNQFTELFNQVGFDQNPDCC